VGYYTDSAWVHRKGKSTWMFQPDPIYGKLAHTTRNGTTYLIMDGLQEGKPFWIGEVTGKTIFTVEKYLRAREIEFSNGGRYVFPKK
jgi:hypothetical protein